MKTKIVLIVKKILTRDQIEEDEEEEEKLGQRYIEDIGEVEAEAEVKL